MFAMRTSLPEKGNKYYNTTSVGGYSKCIQGKCGSTGKPCNGLNVLANCVGWANGRFAEIIGKDKIEYQFISNAENFVDHAIKDYKLQVSNTPTAGGIMVWEGLGELAGHVAIVERVIDSNTIYTSESGYNSTTFWNATRNNNNGRWGMSGSYRFIGCIVNPSVSPEPTPTPVTKDKYQSYDNVQKEWLPKVTIGSNDYAGNFGHSLGGLRLPNHKYRMHEKGGGWFEWVTKADNTPQGYAGLYGHKMDGLQIEGATYRVHTFEDGWLPWVSKVDNTPDGYAGIWGHTIDGIQIK